METRRKRGMMCCHDNESQWTFVIIIALIAFSIAVGSAQEEEFSSLSFTSSEGFLLPCVYREILHAHGEEWRINECSTCSCANSTIECVIQGCQPTTCQNEIHPPGTCCAMCPYHVNVSRVSPAAKVVSSPKLLTGKLNKLNLNVSVSFKESELSTGVYGENLWNMTIWTSRNRDGDGFAFSVSKNVLSTKQRAQRYRKGKTFPKIRNVKYNLDATGLTCAELKFICVRFDQADKTLHENHEYVPFFFGGYPDDNALTGCSPAPRCKRVKVKPAPTTPNLTTTIPTTTIPTTNPTTTTAMARSTIRRKVRLTPNHKGRVTAISTTATATVVPTPFMSMSSETLPMHTWYQTPMPQAITGWIMAGGNSDSNEDQFGPMQPMNRAPLKRAHNRRRGGRQKALANSALAVGLSSNEVQVLQQKKRKQLRRRHEQRKQEARRSGPNRQQRQRLLYKQQKARQQHGGHQQQYNQQQHQLQRQQTNRSPYLPVRSGQINPLYQRAQDAAIAEGTLEKPLGWVPQSQRQPEFNPYRNARPRNSFDPVYVPIDYSEEQ